MPNGKQIKLTKNNKAGNWDLVVAMKLIILLVIFIVPLSFMLFDVSRNLLVWQSPKPNYSQATLNHQTVKGVGDDFNFQVVLPTANASDLQSIPKEKIDSLFSNLKK